MNRRDFIHTAALTPVLLAAGPQDDLAKKVRDAARHGSDRGVQAPGRAIPGSRQKLAAPAIAKQITQDVAAGLKAFRDGKGDQAEAPSPARRCSPTSTPPTSRAS
jgi:hypothetical protein